MADKMPTWPLEIVDENGQTVDIVEIDAPDEKTAWAVLRHKMEGGAMAAPMGKADIEAAAQAEATAQMPGMYGVPGMTPSPEAQRGIATGLAKRVVVGPGQGATWAYANTVGRGLNAMGLSDQTPDDILANYNNSAGMTLDSVRGSKLEEASAEAAGWETAADIGAAIALSPTGKLTGLTKAIGLGASEAGFFALTTFDRYADMASKSKSTALGTLLGGAATLGFKAGGVAIGKGGQWILNRINRNKREGQEEVVAELGQQFEGLDANLTMGQRSGSEQMLKLEAEIAGNKALEAYRAQAEIIETGLKEFGKRWGSWNPAEVGAIAAKRGRAAIRGAYSDMAKIRKEEWDGLIAAAEASMTVPGAGAKVGDLVTQGQNMFASPRLQQNLVDLLDGHQISKKNLDGIFRQFAEEVTTFNGQVSLDTLLKMLKQTNRENFTVATGLSDDAARNFGKEFREMIFEAIDDADPQQSQAVQFIKGARDSYKQRSEDMEVLRDSGIAKFLGIDSKAPNPMDALRSLKDMAPDEAARTATWLSKEDPALLSEIRKVAWDDAMKEATNKAATTAHPFDPLKFTQDMLKRLEGNADDLDPAARHFRTLFSEADRAQMNHVLPMISRIMAHPPKGARAFDTENFAMTMGGAALSVGKKGPEGIFQFLPFVIRNMYRLGASDWLDERIFTAAGRRLIEDADKAIGTSRYHQAVGALAAYMAGDEPKMGLERLKGGAQ